MFSRNDLIDAIEKRPALWQSTHPNRRNKRVLNKLWNEIVELSGSESLQVVKARWKNLKDTFRKEIKKNDDSEPSNWVNYQRMSFLKDEMCNLTFARGSDDDDPEQLIKTKTPVRTRPPDRTRSSSSAASNASEEIKKPEKHTASSLRLKFLELERKKLEAYLANKRNKKLVAKRNNSEDYHYLMSLLPQMKTFSAAQKFRVRNKINNIMLEEMDPVPCHNEYDDHAIKTEMMNIF